MIVLEDKQGLDKTCKDLRDGKVIGLPTETVYGLAADATCDDAVASIYSYKKRPRFHPLISHVSSSQMAADIVECDADLLDTLWLQKKWSISLILKRKAHSALSWLTTGGLSTVAVRYPQHDSAQKIIEAYGKPLAAPSANLFGQLSPVSAHHVVKAFPNITVMDGGGCRLGVESTIVDLTSDTPNLIRPGAVPREDLQNIWPDLVHISSDVAAPGNVTSHYKTQLPLFINALKPASDSFFIGFGDVDCDVNLSPKGCLYEAAANIFKVLHDADQKKAGSISIAPIPNQSIGEAINDRLKKAASYDYSNPS